MDFTHYKNQAINVTHKLLNTIPFIVKNKLWEGFFKHRLVLSVSILCAIIIPYSLFSNIGDYFTVLDGLNDKHTLSVSTAFQHFNPSKLFDLGNPYLLMLLIHMLNVYFSYKTIERLSGVVINLSLKEMIVSFFRNIKVVVRTWFTELIIGILISIFLGIFAPDWVTDSLKFFVSCYLLGYIFIDNYNAGFAIPIKDSFRIIKKHAGASFCIGLVAKILFLLPVVGVLCASFICGVASTWYMHTSEDRQDGALAYSDDLV